MPTVLREHGVRFMIFVDDHAPPHVHAFGDGEAKIEIGRDGSPPVMIYSVEMGIRLQRRVMAAVATNQALLMQKWVEIHGRDD